MKKRVLRGVFVGLAVTAATVVASFGCVGDEPAATGADAATDTATSSDGTGTSDASGDTGAGTGFCATPGFLFCEDFDDGNYSGWNVVSTAAGIDRSFVQNTRAASNGLALRVHTDATSGAALDARITHGLTLPSSFSEVRLGFDVRFETRVALAYPATAVTLSDTGFNSELLNSVQSDAGVVQILATALAPDGGLGFLANLVEEPSDWATYELVFTRTDSGAFMGQAYFNGTAMAASIEVAPLTGTATQLWVGIYSNTPSGENTFDFDNVYVIAH